MEMLFPGSSAQGEVRDRPLKEGGISVVKGVTRQVVVVKAPDPELFDEAIFLVRSEAVGKDGVTDEDILREARQAAGRYVTGKVRGGRQGRISWGQLLCMLAGAAAVGLVWLLCAVL
jgi:hypothetical protein